jgi:uncharacterized protein with PhoU and TrkA domain
MLSFYDSTVSVDIFLEEKIHYQPISVRDSLIALQSTTTLMIDLAYSAVLFNDRDLAEEVVELENKVDDLKILLLMNMGLAMRDADDAEGMVGIMQMGTVADRISEAAGDIARTVLLDLGIDPSIMEAFTKTQERLIRTKILSGSVLAKKRLDKLSLETNIGINVIAIRRGKELITNPKPKTMLMADDILIARGSDVGIAELDKLSKGELKAIPRPKLDIKEDHP